MALQGIFKTIQTVATKVTQEIGKHVPKELSQEFQKGLNEFTTKVESLAKNSGTLESLNLSDTTKGFQKSLNSFSETFKSISENLQNVNLEEFSKTLEELGDFIKEVDSFIKNLEGQFKDVESFNYGDLSLAVEQLETAKKLLSKFEELIEKLPDAFEPDEINDEDLEELSEGEN